MEHILSHDMKELSDRQVRANGIGYLAGLQLFAPEAFRSRTAAEGRLT